MRKIFACTLVFFLVVGCDQVGPQPTPPPAPPTPDSVVQELLAAHNKIRTEKGLVPFALNPKLTVAANGHAAFMDAKKIMAHEMIGDGTPYSRMIASGYYYSNAGENIAMDPQGVQGVMMLWIGSPGHLANILGNYKDVGFGVSGAYYCVDFGTPPTVQATGTRASSTSHQGTGSP